MVKSGYTYIMTNVNKTVLYVGVTSDLEKSITQHKTHHFKGSFNSRYNLEICIYYEEFPTITEAIIREKEIKKWNRSKKENLINKVNPDWVEISINTVNPKSLFRDEVTKLLQDFKNENESTDN